MTAFETLVGAMQRLALQRTGLHLSCHFLNRDVLAVLHQLHLLTLGFRRRIFATIVHILDFEVSREMVV